MIIALSLIAIIGISLVACGQKEKDAAKTSENENKKVETASIDSADKEESQGKSDKNEDEELVTLEWLTYQYGVVDDDAPVKKMLEEKFNVKFNIWYIDVTKREELLGTRLASGQIPDFMTVYSDADLLKFYEQGIIQGLSSEEIEQYLPNWKKYIDSYDPKLWIYAKQQDTYMGIPNVNFDGIYNKPVAWRGDWLEKLGINKVPETLEEFEDVMYKFRNNDPDGNGKKDTYGMSSTAMMNIYGAFGVTDLLWWGEKDGELQPYPIYPEMKQALEVLSKWKKDDVIDPEWVTGENKGGYWAISHAFINGRIGVSSLGESYHWTPQLYEGGWEGQNSQELKKATNGEGSIVFGPPPKGPEGKYGNLLGGLKSTTYMAIGSKADEIKKHRILKIWDTIYGDFDLWLNVRYGEKDKHYEIAPDGITIVMKEGYKNPDEMAKIGAHITFAPFGKSDFQSRITRPEGAQFNKEHFVWEGAGVENKLKVALPSETKYKESLEKLIKETFTAIINGDKPLDYFDTFVEEFKKSGGDELIKEANEWYKSLE